LMEEKTIFSEKRQIQVPQQPFFRLPPEFADSVIRWVSCRGNRLTFCRVGENGRVLLLLSALCLD
jgi:hypothetical protein